ncbi:MAG: hypothetical protein GTO41_11840 [Burkholderiales bacterium]|nr:hypothetical protein [Burkholderiales bacterium]
MPEPKRILGDPFATPKPKKKPRQRVRDGKIPLWERIPLKKTPSGYLWEIDAAIENAVNEMRRRQNTDSNNA